MKTLLLIPSLAKAGMAAEVAGDLHPTMDYDALAAALRSRPGDEVLLLDYAAVDRDTHPAVRAVRKIAGRDAALAMMGFLKREQYDAIYSNGENVALPLALLLKTQPSRPRHVTIGHRLSTGKKRVFYKHLRVHREMDTIFVYATTQRDFAEHELAIPSKVLRLIPFHADHRFYRPLAEQKVIESQICAAGLEWRDYPTLIQAVANQTDLQVKLAAASPWSKHENETKDRVLPAHVDARRYDYNALRTLYAQSAFVVVPLYENDFQAGITTILEAMAIGKAVIVTRTAGQTDAVIDGENGLYVSAGDVAGWQRAIARLRADAALRERLGSNARRWLEQNATLERWVEHVVAALRGEASPALHPSSPALHP